MAEPTITVEKFSEYIAKQCPPCRRGVEVGEIIVLCPLCKTPHHEDCWYDNGGCGKLGCRGVASARPTGAASALQSARSQRSGGGEEAVQAKGGLPQGAVAGAVAVIAFIILLWIAIRGL